MGAFHWVATTRMGDTNLFTMAEVEGEVMETAVEEDIRDRTITSRLIMDLHLPLHGSHLLLGRKDLEWEYHRLLRPRTISHEADTMAAVVVVAITDISRPGLLLHRHQVSISLTAAHRREDKMVNIETTETDETTDECLVGNKRGCQDLLRCDMRCCRLSATQALQLKHVKTRLKYEGITCACGSMFRHGY